MHWDDLRFFLSVARCGLISKAAAELGTDPTTVSRRIQRLEETVGQTLLERHRTGPRLTAAGNRIADQAAAMEAASLSVAEQGRRASLLRVSASEGFGTWFVAHHLADFARNNPGTEVELVATSGFLNPSRRETDIAILLAKPRRGPLATRKLGDYTLRLYGSRKLVTDVNPIESAADLRRQSLIGYIPDLIYAPELDYLDEIGSGLHTQVRSSSINAQHRLIAAGAGVGVLPRFIGDADVSLVAVLPAVTITRSFWLSIHLDARRKPHVRKFSDWLFQTAYEQRATLHPSDNDE
jgi:DNA-binding transcriptional LysR family regulator